METDQAMRALLGNVAVEIAGLERRIIALEQVQSLATPRDGTPLANRGFDA
jgi:hypothetical protein